MKDRMKSQERVKLETTGTLSEREKTLWRRLLRDARSIAQREHLMKTWGGWSYQVHIDRTDDVLVDFGYGDDTLFGFQRRVAMQFHDMIEDCGWTYNDVKEFVKTAIGTICDSHIAIADIAYALTDEKGRNRGQRKPDKLYKAMAKDRDFVVCKLADRVVNRERAGSMGQKYDKEYPGFRTKLYKKGMCDNMWNYLDELHSFKEKKK